MPGVGSSTALNAFNIGQASQGGGTAIGRAIEGIVAQSDKLAVTQGQSTAQTAGALATAQFKDELANRPQDVFQATPQGLRLVGRDIAGGKGSVVSSGTTPFINQVAAGQGSPFPVVQGGGPQLPVVDGSNTAPAVDPGGAQSLGGVQNVNRVLTPEEVLEAIRARRLQLGQ